MLTCDDYLVPLNLQDALTVWRQAPDGSRLLAGATDTLPWARQGRAGDVTGDVHVPTIIDVSHAPELGGYEVLANGRLRLGANLVFQQFLEDPVLQEHLPHMPSCAIWFADDQIRRQATIAGNIVNASPAADGIPPLVALNAVVELARLQDGKIQRRAMPLITLIEGPGRTGMAADEILTGITCDSARGYGGSFEKVGQRRSLVISAACAACCVKPSSDGLRFEDVRLALGGVGPVPMRLDDVEAILIGQPISSDVIRKAAALPADRVASRTRQAYRRDVVRGFTERALRDALAMSGVSVADQTTGGEGARHV